METTFAQKIRELRSTKDWSVYDLAKKIGKTPGYVSKIEARGEIPAPEMIIKLAEAFGVNAEELTEIAKKEKSAELVENVCKKYDGAVALYRKEKKTRGGI